MVNNRVNIIMTVRVTKRGQYILFGGYVGMFFFRKF
jgi:hypothetical protein